MMIKAHSEEKKKYRIVLLLQASFRKKMKNWFCNRGFSPPEKMKPADIRVETELVKNSSSNQKCNSLKVQDEDQDINKKIVIHEIITIKPSPTISVPPTGNLGLQSYQLNDTDNTAFKLKKKSVPVETIGEIDMSFAEKIKDIPHDQIAIIHSTFQVITRKSHQITVILSL
ncbi:hypothetical protein WA026_016520 [Henosepilachna vigintioctopunctata]|uniref:Uncharacterized protein n=1 Tax=Henosepilachna vigintioctopunctata TaxID=420089 RepID=A0AAW1V8S2_9CUCU